MCATTCQAIEQRLLESKIDACAQSRKVDQPRATLPCPAETRVGAIALAAHHKRVVANARIQLESGAQRAVATQPKVGGVEIGRLQKIAGRREEIRGVLLVIPQTRHEGDRALKSFVQRQIKRVRTHAEIVVIVTVVSVQRAGLRTEVTPPRRGPRKLVALFGPAVDELVRIAQKTRSARGANAALYYRELIENLGHRDKRRTVRFRRTRNAIKQKRIGWAKLIVRVGGTAANRRRVVSERDAAVDCDAIGSVVVFIGDSKADAEITVIEIASTRRCYVAALLINCSSAHRDFRVAVYAFDGIPRRCAAHTFVGRIQRKTVFVPNGRGVTQLMYFDVVALGAARDEEARVEIVLFIRGGPIRQYAYRRRRIGLGR